MKKLKNKGCCLECGQYFYECDERDICPECEKVEDDHYEPGEGVEILEEPWEM